LPFSSTTSVSQYQNVAILDVIGAVDYLLETAVGIGMNGISLGNHSYTDLDFADDVCLLAELMKLLVPVLEALAIEAESLGLEVN